LRYQGCGVADVSVNLSSDLVIARNKARLELVELSRPPVCLPDDVAAKPRHLQGASAEDLVWWPGRAAASRLPWLLLALHEPIVPQARMRLLRLRCALPLHLEDAGAAGCEPRIVL